MACALHYVLWTRFLPLPCGLTPLPSTPSLRLQGRFRTFDDKDQNVGERQLYVAITALHTAFRILLWPRSHHAVEELAVQHGFYLPGGFRDNSTAKVDQVIAGTFGEEQQPIMLTIQPGQTVIFDGYLVHAGAPSQLDDEGNVIPCYRLHRYIGPEGEEMELGKDGAPISYPLSNMHPNLWTVHFAKKWWNLSESDLDI